MVPIYARPPRRVRPQIDARSKITLPLIGPVAARVLQEFKRIIFKGYEIFNGVVGSSCSRHIPAFTYFTKFIVKSLEVVII